MTKNQREFQKQIKRLERSMKRLLKRDIYVPQYDLPEQPKRVTRQMLAKLEALKGRDFLAKIDTETGEAFIGKQPEIRSRRRKHEQTYLPNHTAFNEIRERFLEAEQSILSMYNIPYLHDVADYRLKMVRHLIDTLDEQYRDKDGIYIAFLQSNQELIAELLSAIQWYDSNQPNVEAQYTELLMVLRMEVGEFREEYLPYTKGLDKVERQHTRLQDLSMQDLSDYAEHLQDINEFI